MQNLLRKINEDFDKYNVDQVILICKFYIVIANLYYRSNNHQAKITRIKSHKQMQHIPL